MYRDGFFAISPEPEDTFARISFILDVVSSAQSTLTDTVLTLSFNAF